MLAFAIPGDISTQTGGYVYDRRLTAALLAMGVSVNHIVLPARFPFPDAADLDATLLLLQQAGPGPLLVDGLAFGALPLALIARLPRPLLALVHHPLGLETGLTLAQSLRLVESERRALAQADRVIVTSATTAATLLADFGVSAGRLDIVLPGTDPAPRARAYAAPQHASGAPVRILAAGAIVARKGYDVLVEALAGMSNSNWHLQIAGSLDRAPQVAKALEAQIARAGLHAHIELCGVFSQSRMAQAYAQADLFVLASHYEGYGMVLAEAMACGLPIVTTTGGAAAQTVPDACALKVPPGDAAALRHALQSALGNRALRSRLAQAAWSHGQTLPRWHEIGAQVADILGTMTRAS